ncbi:phospholipase [Paraglaciecola Antarctic GD virus 1]|nr:phospholipase [Paraglaciecola Antarctic GD virus 1]
MLFSKHSKHKYKLEAAHSFKISDDYFAIPKGFTSDGATIPKMFWKIIGSPFSPDFIEAAFVHDYLIYISYDGKLRDQKFYEVLLKNDVGRIRARVMWYGVTIYRKLFL